MKNIQIFITLFFVQFTIFSFGQTDCYHWKNSSIIPYLTERPTEQQIIQYQKYFDKNRVDSWNPSHAVFGSLSHETAVTDFICGTQNHLFDEPINYHCILWRLNEFYPLANESGTQQERYMKLNAQIDSLLSYEAENNFDWNVQGDLRECLQRAILSYFQEMLKKQYKNDSDFLRVIKLWDKYVQASKEVCSSVIGDYYASGASFEKLEFTEQILKQLETWLYCCLEISTGKVISNHIEITDEMFMESYDKIIIRTTKEFDEQYVTGQYSLQQKIKNLRTECQSWLEWLNAMKNYSSKHPSLKLETMIEQIARDKYVELKNEYTQYGLHSGELDEILLPRNCTDKELIEFELEY